MDLIRFEMYVTGGRLDAVYDGRAEEILQRDEETRIQETTKTDPQTQGKCRLFVFCAGIFTILNCSVVYTHAIKAADEAKVHSPLRIASARYSVKISPEKNLPGKKSPRKISTRKISPRGKISSPAEKKSPQR